MSRNLEFKHESGKIPFTHQVFVREDNSKWLPATRAGHPLIYRTSFEAEIIAKALNAINSDPKKDFE